MNADELRSRTSEFARRVAVFIKPLRRDPAAKDVVSQLARAANGMAANYRSACLSRSRAEFRSRLAVVLEEADECVYWLEHLRAARLASGNELEELHDEAKQLVRIFASSRRTSRLRARLNDYMTK